MRQRAAHRGGHGDEQRELAVAPGPGDQDYQRQPRDARAAAGQSPME